MTRNRITDYLRLPKEITDFERAYLLRVNRIGLVFFALHVPIFAAVAAFNETGAMTALVATSLAVLGPLIAYLTFGNPRAVSVTYGFTAMVMGALLVHFAQGPVQIEMHFYFFALLAMLALYANPMVIIVAALTVAVHHLLFWMYLPKSVFNYDAPLWVVAVHATFVVIESVATCCIARSYFDHVIGLEKIVERRTRELDAKNSDLTLILDNVEQGFVTIDRDGVIIGETSAVVETWFGPRTDGSFAGFLSSLDAGVGEAFECGWEQLQTGILPLELCFDQLPSAMVVAGRNYHIVYNPILAATDAELNKTVIVISDVTDQLARAALEAEARESMHLFDRLLRDRSGFLEFYEEAEDYVAAIADDAITDLRLLKRIIHTLKGNAGLYGVQTIADLCHTMEAVIEDEHERPRAKARAQLLARWQRLKSNLSKLIDGGIRSVVEIDDVEYRAVLADVRGDTERQAIAERIRRRRLEPTSRRLERIAEQARRIARRLGKADVEVVIDDNDLYLEPRHWSGFWSSFVHVVRNAVDHGIETRAIRAERGKRSPGRLTLSTSLRGERFCVALRDDGPGVDLAAVRERAAALEIEVGDDNEAIEALFADGLSTATEISEFSGRGIGLSAVRIECERIGGEVAIETERGRGTIVQFSFPVAAMAPTRNHISCNDPRVGFAPPMAEEAGASHKSFAGPF